MRHIKVIQPLLRLEVNFIYSYATLTNYKLPNSALNACSMVFTFLKSIFILFLFDNLHICSKIVERKKSNRDFVYDDHWQCFQFKRYVQAKENPNIYAYLVLNHYYQYFHFHSSYFSCDSQYHQIQIHTYSFSIRPSQLHLHLSSCGIAWL